MKARGGGVADALGFLTILPVGRRRALGTPFFPLVGLLIGVAVAAPLVLPLPALPRAVLALVVWTLVSGGLHEDGWADCMDAALAHAEPERRRAILKDPHVGAHGLTATVLLLLGRLGALAAVAPPAVLIAPLVGRWAMVLAPARFPPPAGSGLGGFFSRQARPGAASVAAIAGLLLVLLLGGPGAGMSGPKRALALCGATVAGLAAGGLLGTFLARRLGGLNGDGYGAVGVVAELTTLWALLPWGTAL